MVCLFLLLTSENKVMMQLHYANLRCLVSAPILALPREAVFNDRQFLTDFPYYGMLFWSVSLTKRCSFTWPTCFSEKKILHEDSFWTLPNFGAIFYGDGEKLWKPIFIENYENLFFIKPYNGKPPLAGIGVAWLSHGALLLDNQREHAKKKVQVSKLLKIVTKILDSSGGQ